MGRLIAEARNNPQVIEMKEYEAQAKEYNRRASKTDNPEEQGLLNVLANGEWRKARAIKKTLLEQGISGAVLRRIQ